MQIALGVDVMPEGGQGNSGAAVADGAKLESVEAVAMPESGPWSNKS